MSRSGYLHLRTLAGLLFLLPLGTVAAWGHDGLSGTSQSVAGVREPCTLDGDSIGPPCGSGLGDEPHSEKKHWLRVNPEKPYWRTNLFKRLLTDQPFLWTTWWGKEVRRPGFSVPLFVAVASASTSSTGGVDLKIERSVSGWATGSRSDVATAFTQLGDAKTAVVLLGSAYLISRWRHNERWSRATSLSAEALINAGIYEALLKRLARRTRPASGGTGEFFVNSPPPGQEANSFPSGHAMGAFAVATVFASEWHDHRWVPWVAYGTASLIALSRVALGRHFVSDVLAGAVLGNSLGRMVVYRNGEGPDEPVSRFEPLYEPSNGGVGVVYHRSW